MSKRYITLLLSIALLLISLASCKQSAEPTAVDTYINMAQEFLDTGDLDSAIDILNKGYTATNDARILLMLEEISPHGNADAPVESLETSPVVPPAVTSLPTQQTDPIVSTPSFANIKKIKSDLISAGGNIFNINFEPISLEFSTAEILRRKSDSEYDEVYISANLQNDYYSVNAEYTLYYSYYDVGGWILDDYILTYYKSYATANPISNTTFEQIILNDFDTCTITSRTQDIDNSGVFYDTITFNTSIDYNYLSVKYSCTAQMVFYDDYWHESLEYIVLGHDWSRILGTWQYVHDNGDYLSFTIESLRPLSEENCLIGYNYSSSAWEWLSVYDNQLPHIEPSESRQKNYLTDKTTIMGSEFTIPSYFVLSVHLGDLSDGETFAELADMKISRNGIEMTFYADTPAGMSHDKYVVNLEKTS